ncbi:MAG TPA: VOC family protein [Thermoplasmata archaeon]|nr:VOC family protein [Thermoplasmata archaeon]
MPPPRRATRKTDRPIKVLFIAGFGPIGTDSMRSRALYEEALGIGFEQGPDGYLHTGKLDGAKHFAIWPLDHAAESCFGTPRWPAKVPRPQAWIEFDVEDVAEATAHLKRQGYRTLVESREESWGQTVTRLLGPEGLLIGLTFTPSLRTDP